MFNNGIKIREIFVSLFLPWVIRSKTSLKWISRLFNRIVIIMVFSCSCYPFHDIIWNIWLIFLRSVVVRICHFIWIDGAKLVMWAGRYWVINSIIVLISWDFISISIEWKVNFAWIVLWLVGYIGMFCAWGYQIFSVKRVLFMSMSVTSCIR